MSTVTIEKTSKQYKLAHLISVLLWFPILVFIASGYGKVALFTFVVSMGLYGYARIGAWWNNG
jgi:hypothetical protein